MNTQRPNQVTVEKRTNGALSPTLQPSLSVVTVNANIPARLQPRRASIPAQFVVEGEVYIQDAYLFLDGISPSQFAGKTPGQTVTVNGIVYTVAPNALSAWPEIDTAYRVTDEYGKKYFVLAVAHFDVTHSLQAALASGKSW